MSLHRSPEPVIAIVTKAKGTFFKPLYEAFARAQPPPWKTVLFWPEGLHSEHPAEAVTPCVPNLEIRLIPTAKIRSTPNRSPWMFLPSLAQWQALSAINARAILIHEYSLFTVGALLFGILHGIPVAVSTEVGERNGCFFSAKTRWWHRLWGRFVDGVVACSPAALEPLIGKKVPVFSAYHAMDSRIYRPIERHTTEGSPVVFAYLGQLIHRKGLDLFFRAAARLRARSSQEFRIRLIGGGDESWIRGLIADFALEGTVELTGFLSGPAIREALGRADVFVLPTRQDTYAAVVHEAACLALPLLISKHAGSAGALVEDGRNGFVFDPENCEEFALRMEQLMNAQLRENMSTRSRSIGETNSAHHRGSALWRWMEQTFAL